MKKKILIVDDEEDLREILQFNLELDGYQVDTAASAEEADQVLTLDHSLLLLDVMMKGRSGFDLAQQLQSEERGNIPIIFLTARDAEADLLKGFDLGADDYIAKPFSLQEVKARVKAVLRRHEKAASSFPSAPALTALPFTLNEEKKQVVVDGAAVALSKKEWGILRLLCDQPSKVYSREDILEQVWQGESYVLARTVDVHIARLRRKLGSLGERIINRQGHGYCIE